MSTTAAPRVSAAPPAPFRDVPKANAHVLRGRIAIALKYVSLLAGCFAALVPILVVVFTSLKSKAEYAATGPFTPPANWFHFDNYVEFFDKASVLRSLFNTGFILVLSVAGTVLIGSMAAYALNRFDFKIRGLVIALFLVATLVPPITNQVAVFPLVVKMGLYDTRWSMILLSLGTDIVSIYIFMQFIQGIPKELDEAAALDGANHVTIFVRIIFPLLKPAIATVIIIKGIFIYNDYYTPFLYMPSSDLGVMSTSLSRFSGPFGSQWELISAGVVVLMIPTLILFLFLQRYIYNGFTSGSTK